MNHKSGHTRVALRHCVGADTIEHCITTLPRSIPHPQPLSQRARGASSETELSFGFEVINRRRSTRRAFLLAAAVWPALAWIDAACAESAQAPILIGYLDLGSRESSAYMLAAFREGLAALGWKEGLQFTIDERWADGRPARLQRLAEELAARNPALIVATPLRAVAAAAKAAPKSPIVMATGGDLVAAGFAASLARPGGMVTGVINLGVDLTEKYLELLLAAAPKLRLVGFLTESTLPNRALRIEAARRSVAQRAMQAHFAEAASPEEIELAISRLAKDGVQGLVVLGGFRTDRQRIINVALAQRWPVIAQSNEFAVQGALLSYGIDLSENYRRAAYYVDRILKGAKPGDLPIEQPTRFELVVNAKTAKALGLTISQELLLRADKVIE